MQKDVKATCPLCRSVIISEEIKEEYRKLEDEGKRDHSYEKELALLLLSQKFQEVEELVKAPFDMILQALLRGDDNLNILEVRRNTKLGTKLNKSISSPLAKSSNSKLQMEFFDKVAKGFICLETHNIIRTKCRSAY
ncbi:hypothetical protein HAX54_027211 [Datura stramonium]|uniref:Uncharacterized protein n=1 Tax=Datura stramonium TaxID=4076 RepID=A0ABS8RKL9_DATST|nr:hypothetical protein [Datura stramonium]